MANRKISGFKALTSPASGDLIPIVDVSEAASTDKNKSITFGTLFRTLPDGSVGAPAVGFLSDLGTSGIYRTAANEVAFSNNSVFTGKFTTAGFQLGTGTAAAQLHLFSGDTTDQVIIENTDTGLDTAPDVVLYRNSASPAANDNLGNIEFRGEDSAGNTHAYAQIFAQISDPTDAAEDGILDLIASNGGVNGALVRLLGGFVGINQSAPEFSLHVGNEITGTALQVESDVDDPASAADITLYHHRDGGAGVAEDILSSVFFRGNNDNATPAQFDYAGIEGSIVDPTDTEEDGRLELQIAVAGTLTPQLKIEPLSVSFGNGQATAADVISTLNFEGENDNATPETINYAAIEATIVDPTDGSEDGRIRLQTQVAGTLSTQLDISGGTIGFFGAAAAAQPAAITDITTTATTGALPAADDTNTIADAASPTNAELLQYCVTLEAKLESALAALRTLGLIAT